MFAVVVAMGLGNHPISGAHFRIEKTPNGGRLGGGGELRHRQRVKWISWTVEPSSPTKTNTWRNSERNSPRGGKTVTSIQVFRVEKLWGP